MVLSLVIGWLASTLMLAFVFAALGAQSEKIIGPYKECEEHLPSNRARGPLLNMLRDNKLSYLKSVLWLLFFICLVDSPALAEGVHYTPPIEISAPTCPLIGNPSNPRSRLNLHQIQSANLDLMSAETTKLGVGQFWVHIGLVDGNISAIVKEFGGLITIGLQNPVAEFSTPGEYREHWDHGVEVADVLSIAAPGSYIRSFQAFDGPHRNDFDAVASVRKACDEGDLVINLSASNEGIPLQYTYPHLHSELAEHGCVLIEASGNTPKPELQMSWDFITVGALDLQGKKTGFSTPGIVYAPGVGWFVSNALGEVGPHAGTSYAAPATTAIVKNIYSVLMLSSDFKNTQHSQHVAAVERILIDSSHVDADKNKDVDGYRAVLLASYVQQHGILSYLDARDRLSYVYNAMAAAHLDLPLSKCSSLLATSDCQAAAACYTRKRKYISANEDASPVDWEDLRATANNSNEPVLAYEWAVKLSAANPQVLQSFVNSEQNQPVKIETSTPSQKTSAPAPREAPGAWSYSGSTSIRDMPSLFPPSPISGGAEVDQNGSARSRDTNQKSALVSPDVATAGGVTVVPKDRSSFLGSGSLWHHNGSTLTLKANGAERMFYYEQPRIEMEQRGVQKGTLLFQGKRVGDSYAGTAYIFTANCGPRGYAVSGQVTAEDRQITMTGRAPRFDARCKQIGDRQDNLTFSLDGDY